MQLLLQQREADRLAGLDRLRILDQVAELGLADGQPKTLDEIGRFCGVTRESIRQIESKTMSELRRRGHGVGDEEHG